MATLEVRIGELEARVAVLTEALRVLARGLAGDHGEEPAELPSEEAARHASELLRVPVRPASSR
jgi:hypothetical protein